MVKVSKRYGLIQRHSQRGRERTDRACGASFLMTTGLGGTGPSLSVSVSTSYKRAWYHSAHSSIGLQLKSMLERAFKWARIQREVANSMSITWCAFVPEWMRMLRAYKLDKKKPNPFEEPDPGMDITYRHVVMD